MKWFSRNSLDFTVQVGVDGDLTVPEVLLLIPGWCLGVQFQFHPVLPSVLYFGGALSFFCVLYVEREVNPK